MIKTWKELKQREDTEHEQALLRLFISSFVFSVAYFLTDASEPLRIYILSLTAVSVVVGIIIGLLILIRPAKSVSRRLCSIFIDIAGMSYGISLGGQWSELLFWLYLFVIIGNGFRYSVNYLYFTAALSLVGYSTASLFNGGWLHDTYFTVGFLFGLAILTTYLAGLLNRLNHAVDAANEANLAKSTFLANMSHEIRTPMNGVLGMLDIALTNKMDDSLRKHIEIAQSSANSLMSLLNDILDLSKLDADKMDFECADFDVNKPLEEAVTLFQPEASKKNIHLNYKVSSTTGSHWVNGDALRLRQVLLNLISNAIKFTEQGEVELSVDIIKTKEGIGLNCKVCDTGLGMDESTISHVFNDFAQADETTSRKFGGTGLGLAISQRLIEKMGGNIHVESTLGIGSTFIFTVFVNPVKEQKVEKIKEELEACSYKNKEVIDKSNPSNKPHIMVAEDNPVNQEVIQNILGRLGCTVHLANNGKDVIHYFSKVKECNVDLVFMDIQMPELDGYETIKELHKVWNENPELSVPVIALTACDTAAEKAKCQRAGMDDFMTKPINKKKLIAVLRHFLPNYLPHYGHSMKTLSQPSPKYTPQMSNKSFDMLFDRRTLDGVKAEMGADFSHLVDTYKTDSLATISIMEKDIKHNPDSLKSSSISLKGGSLSVGASKMGELCTSLENDIMLDSSTETIEKMIKKIKLILDVTISELQSVVDEKKVVSTV